MLTEIKNIKLISRYIKLNTLFRGFIMTSMVEEVKGFTFGACYYSLSRRRWGEQCSHPVKCLSYNKRSHLYRELRQVKYHCLSNTSSTSMKQYCHLSLNVLHVQIKFKASRSTNQNKQAHIGVYFTDVFYQVSLPI